MKFAEIKKVYDNLERKGFITYGGCIPYDELKTQFSLEPEHGVWEFLGPLMALKIFIEEQGYFCRTNELQQRLEIMDCDEMAHRSEKLLTSIINRQKRTFQSMNNADVSQLNESDKLKHELATNKHILGMQAMKSVLYKL